MKLSSIFLTFAAMLLSMSCASNSGLDVIFDTDANNEIDDQHAIAYLLLNDDSFNTLAITTNVTVNGSIQAQCDEVQRVATLVDKDVTIIPGATASFEEISGTLDNPEHDGFQAVDFIIQQALAHSPKNKLTVIPVGKLTNVALAIAKEPRIVPNLKVVWLGSNYPDPGEHNMVCDIPSMNYVIESDVELAVSVARYGKPSGTDAVRVTIDRVRNEIAGKGPQARTPVTGRHGGEFTCFGDYSLNLFENIDKAEDGSRALFDMACVAVVKNPEWCDATVIPAPVLVDGQWVERPDNARKVTILENYKGTEIINDFINILAR
ncbi:MAG: nucleoside hydrolase [Bacteroidales bacterium]|nr:nucleoside hydrolase [Bacteroidales bacterium]